MLISQSVERMKKYELVKLLSNDYGAIKKGDYGAVLTVSENTSEVMFFQTTILAIAYLSILKTLKS